MQINKAPAMPTFASRIRARLAFGDRHHMSGTPHASGRVMRLLPTMLIASCATAAPIQRRAPEMQETVAPIASPSETAIVPWFRSWDAADERVRLARFDTDAVALETEHARVCGTVWPRRVTGSPLLRYRTGGWNTRTGAIVYLSPLAGPGDEFLDDVRCHFIRLVLAPFGDEGSPFELPGFHIDARGDAAGIELVVTVAPSSVFELQRRLGQRREESARSYYED
jgi:hypothetical protein